MTERTCHWSGCKTIIQVDTSIESKQTLFTVAGWCDVHSKAFNIYTELEKQFCKDFKIDWPIGSLSYKKHKKALNVLHKQAGKMAEGKCV